MKTFSKFASVLRIGFTHWTMKKRRMWLKHCLEQHEKLNIIEIDALEPELMFI